MDLMQYKIRQVGSKFQLMSVGAVLSSPVVAGDFVYFGSTDGNLYALR
jgi:outer membrane protein assembly factor BamB